MAEDRQRRLARDMRHKVSIVVAALGAAALAVASVLLVAAGVPAGFVVAGIVVLVALTVAGAAMS